MAGLIPWLKFVSAAGSDRFTYKTIEDAVKLGCDWYRRERLTVSEEDRKRITWSMIARYEDAPIDNAARVSLTEAIVRELRDLLDAKHMAALGAVPMLGDKLQPIEDEL